jgi:hypothetical protein
MEHPAQPDDDIETVSEGYFRYREKKGAPWQPLRVMRESGLWMVFLNGKLVEGSGKAKAKDIPFLLWRSPFQPINEAQYHALLDDYASAPPGHPLRRPGEPVDLRNAPVLYGDRARD